MKITIFDYGALPPPQKENFSPLRVSPSSPRAISNLRSVFMNWPVWTRLANRIKQYVVFSVWLFSRCFEVHPRCGMCQDSAPFMVTHCPACGHGSFCCPSIRGCLGICTSAYHECRHRASLWTEPCASSVLTFRAMA